MEEKRFGEFVRLLPVFCAVAEEGSITAAGELLQLPQPTVSRAVARLSDLVGAPLVRRRGRGIELTAAGEALLPSARDGLTRLREGLVAVRRQEEIGSGQLSMAFQTILGERVVPALIKRFRDRHPGVRFELAQGSRRLCLDALASGHASIALIADPPQPADPPTDQPDQPDQLDQPEQLGVEVVPLYDEALVVVAAADHRLAGRTVCLADLDDEPLIVLKPGYGIRDQTERWFAEAGLRLQIAFEVDDARTARGLAEAGLGVTLVPAGRGEEVSAHELRLDDPHARRTVAALLRTGDDATVGAFGQFLRAAGRGVALGAL